MRSRSELDTSQPGLFGGSPMHQDGLPLDNRAESERLARKAHARLVVDHETFLALNDLLDSQKALGGSSADLAEAIRLVRAGRAAFREACSLLANRLPGQTP